MINRVRLLICAIFRSKKCAIPKCIFSGQFCKISEVFMDFNEIVNSNTPRARVGSRRRFVRNTERDTIDKFFHSL